MEAPKALFIADERSAEGVLGEMLRDCGYQVILCTDQLAGLRALARERFDITIVNLDAPTVDAPSFLQALESRDIETVLLLRSDQLEPELVLRALRAGADDLIRNSGVSPETVMAHINRAMVRRHRIRHRYALLTNASSNSSLGLLQLVGTTALALQDVTALEDAVGYLLKGCQEGMNCDAVALLLLGPETMGSDLYLRSRLSLSPETVRTLKLDLIERAANLVKRTIDEDRVRLHQQSFGKHPILNLSTQELFQTLCASPLIVHGEAIGLMMAAAVWPNAFHEDQMRLLSILTSLGAAVIHSLRLTAEGNSVPLIPHSTH